MMSAKPDIQFVNENIDLNVLDRPTLSHWILATLIAEEKSCSFIHFIFCSDEYLHHMNLKHLNHDSYTDILTFEYESDPIEADVFISIDRVKENAEERGLSLDEELHRVIIHGVLHLSGYDDKTTATKKIIRQKEDYYLRLYS